MPIARCALQAALMLVGLSPAAAQGQSIAHAGSRNATAQIHSYLSRLEGYGFSGVVLVGRGDDIIFHRAYGLADQAKKTPMRTDHLFDVGSVTKQFTAAAIVALEEDGKLRVTDSITKYFVGVPADKRGITIHHLLTHTSGLEMGFGRDYARVTRDDIVRQSLASRLQSPPGERHSYSNAGYSVLAVIVELVASQSIETFMRERLFRRARMTSTAYFPRDTQRIARGYLRGRDLELAEKAAATAGEMWNLIGNGGIHSTLADMHRWMLALQHHRLFSRAAREKLLSPHALHSANHRGTGSLHYAYGWYVSKLNNGKTIIWHLGGNGTLNAAVRWHIDDSLLVLYASNTSEFHDPAYPVPAIERILAGDSVLRPPPVVRTAASGTISRYAGRYRLGDELLVVESGDGYLRLRGEGQAAFWFATRGAWVRDTLLEALSVRTGRIVEQSRTRQWEAMHPSYPSETTVERIAEFESLFWRKRHDALGNYVRARLIGSEPAGRRYAGRSLVAIDFTRGSTYREYFWTPDGRIGDLGPLNDLPVSRQYYPISTTCFAAVMPENGQTSRVCFDGDELAVHGADGTEAARLRRER